jgi:hypothetical protein
MQRRPYLLSNSANNNRTPHTRQLDGLAGYNIACCGTTHIDD